MLAPARVMVPDGGASTLTCPAMARPLRRWLTSDDQVLDVLMDFVDAVAGGQRVVVVGSSWGGYHARGLVDRLADRIDGMLARADDRHGQQWSIPSRLRNLLR